MGQESPERTEHSIEEPADCSENTREGTKRALRSRPVLRPREDLARFVASRSREAARVALGEKREFPRLRHGVCVTASLLSHRCGITDHQPSPG